MVDIESEVFTQIATALRQEYPSIFVSGENIISPTTFPAVTIEERDNSVYTSTRDLQGQENHSVLMYVINVYTNLPTGKKKQAKEIINLIDCKMQQLGFVRVGSGPLETPNLQPSIYRITARYRALVSKDKQIII